MAAITTLLLHFKQGDHIVSADDVYGGTYRLYQRVFTEFGLEFSFVDMTDYERDPGCRASEYAPFLD